MHCAIFFVEFCNTVLAVASIVYRRVIPGAKIVVDPKFPRTNRGYVVFNHLFVVCFEMLVVPTKGVACHNAVVANHFADGGALTYKSRAVKLCHIFAVADAV